MAAKLKVFVTGNGFTDYVVATSSRPKALAAWGVSQDLFKEGAARETDDPALIKAALAEPGRVMERAAGSRAALAKPAAGAKARKPAGPSKADLKRVADLEAEVSKLQAAQSDRLAEIAEERAALDRREAKVRTDQTEAMDALKARLAAARKRLKAD
jgi:hypothetical protein